MVLNGIRVIDFGRFIAGPMCAAMLADLGADVIRVERREGGDDRFQYLTGPRGDNGACFLQWNRNKRSLTLDPMAEGASANFVVRLWCDGILQLLVLVQGPLGEVPAP